MFKSFDDWWGRVGKWQQAGRRAIAARGESAAGPDLFWQIAQLRREMELRDAAIEAMLEANPDYDGDLSEFGEEPIERLIRTGAIPPPPWPGLGKR